MRRLKEAVLAVGSKEMSREMGVAERESPRWEGWPSGPSHSTRAGAALRWTASSQVDAGVDVKVEG